MRKLKIKVIPNAKRNAVVEGGGMFKVYVNAPAVEGKANKAVIELLSEYLNVKKSSMKIAMGEKAREKIVEVHTIAR